MGTRRRVTKMLAVMTAGLLLATQAAYADTNVTWKQSNDASYDTSNPGTILMYKNELGQGGYNLSTQAWTNDKSSADLVFDPYGNIGASSLIDLGAVDFDSVASIPDSGYSYEAKAQPNHVYIIATHDGKFAKILVKSVLASNVLFKYALLDQVVTTGGGGTGTVTKTYTFTPGNVDLTWPAVDQAVSYDLYRSDNGGDFVKLTDFPLTDPSFTDKHTIIGHTYLYKYLAYDANGNTLYQSNPIKVVIVDQSQGDTSQNTVIQLTIGQTTATVNGQTTTMPVAPIIVDGRTLVPLRFISEALGAQVNWNGNDQSIDITMNSDHLKLWIDQSKATVNGQTVFMDVPPQIVQDRTMVPLRFVSENLKEQIAFDASTQTITITGSSDSTGPQTPQNPSSNNNLSSFFHTYKLIVPGSVTDSGQAQMGAEAGVLTVKNDGTFTWTGTMSGSYSGKWKATGDSEYPILIQNGEDNHDWKLGVSTPTLGGDVLLWDGYTWQIGTVK